jgi:hypothetical protein
VSHTGQATYIVPRLPSVLSCAVLPAGSHLGAPRTWVPGARASECRSIGTHSALSLGRARVSWVEQVSPPQLAPQSLPLLWPDALRLRTFHSSFHTPSPGNPLIGSTYSDVTTLLPRRLLPSPSQARPRRATGAPLPRQEW